MYDRYRCIPGKVLVNGEDLNLEQVEAGMAWHDKQYQREQSASDRIEYSDAERDAIRQKLGLWRDPNPLPRWDYSQWSEYKMKTRLSVTSVSVVFGLLAPP
jgi:endonuclease YncB( thermonuclease family)